MRAKNLYNRATYQVRQEFFAMGTWLQYTTLYHQLKHEAVYLALKKISDSYLPQQILRQVEQVWRSYFNALKAWKKEPTKFLGRPRLPRYKRKAAKNILQHSSSDSQVVPSVSSNMFWSVLPDRGCVTHPVKTLEI